MTPAVARAAPVAPGRPGGGRLLLAAVTLLAFPAGTLLSAAIGFALGYPVAAADLAGGGALAAAVALGVPLARGGRGAWRAGLPVLAACALVVGAALRIAPLRYDTSFDGQAYHAQATVALARGWNPLGPPLTPADFLNHEYGDHFPKGPWIVGAAVYRLTGRLETAKLLHVVLIVAALLAALAAFRAVAGLGPAAAAACAVLAALDTVPIVQVFTFYVDGPLASSLTAFCAFAYLAVEARDRLALLGMGLATVLVVNAKLTGVPYAVLLWGAAALAAWARSGRRDGAVLGAAGAVALAVAVLGPGWNPYVTNTLRAGHPFYFVAGPRGRDIVQGSRPVAFAGMSRVERLVRATLAVPSGDPTAPARLKLPFTLVEDEATKFHAPDVRLGGFGPFFSGALLVAALAVLLARRRAAVAASLCAAALLATVLVTPEGWWPRLAPQLWLVPIVLAVAPLAAPGRRGGRLAGLLAMASLAADVGVVAVNNLNRNVPVQRAVRRQLLDLAARGRTVDVRFGRFEAIGVRLDEAGVRWRAVARLDCPAPFPLAGTHGVEACVEGVSP